MHFMIVWEITGPSQDTPVINAEILSVLTPYPHTQALTSVFVVTVPNQETLNTIQAQIQALKPKHPTSSINFIVTPLIQGGFYNGLLPPATWTEINLRSKG